MSIPLSFLNQVFIRKLFAFAGHSLLVYDYLITLSLEVTYIWDAPWTIVKALFLINRYGNLIGQTVIMLEETGYLSHNSQKFCASFGLYCTLFAVFSGESIRLLVVMRACAILGCKRSIAVLANTLYILCALAILLVSLYWTMSVKGVQFQYLSETGICFSPVGSNSWFLWFLPLLFDGIILATVCSSLYRVTRWSSCHNPSRLIRLLARDAFWFYFAALFNVLFFMICWTVYRQDPRNVIPILLTFPILSIVGQRLVLNLRRFRTQADSTRDISEEVHRQMAAIIGGGASDFPSDPGMELEELGGNRTVP